MSIKLVENTGYKYDPLYRFCGWEHAEDIRPVKTCGAITAALVHEFFGGEVYSLPLDGGGRHSFNYINGVFADLASEQFGRDALPDFSLAEPVDPASLLTGGDKAERCTLLRERLLTVLAKH